MSAGCVGESFHPSVCITSHGISSSVLLNLASNSLKYTPKGSIVLSLRELTMQPRDKSSDGQRLIEFSVKDTGIGMSSEYKKEIFTPFSQESTFSASMYISVRPNVADLSQIRAPVLV